MNVLRMTKRDGLVFEMYWPLRMPSPLLIALQRGKLASRQSTGRLTTTPGQARSALRAFSRACTWTNVNAVQPRLSNTIIFPFHLLAEIVKFALPTWANFEAFFYYPATFRAKICSIRKLKSTIETNLFCHCCSLFPANGLAFFNRAASQRQIAR